MFPCVESKRSLQVVPIKLYWFTTINWKWKSKKKKENFKEEKLKSWSGYWLRLRLRKKKKKMGDDSSSQSFFRRHWEGYKEFWGERFSFYENYSRFTNRDKPLPSWSSSDVEDFIASDPVHGPTVSFWFISLSLSLYLCCCLWVFSFGFLWFFIFFGSICTCIFGLFCFLTSFAQ